MKTCNINSFMEVLSDADNVYLTSSYIVAQRITITNNSNQFFSYLTSEDTFFEITEERLQVCKTFIGKELGGLGRRIKTLSSTRRYYA